MYGDGVFRATEEKGIRELEITPGPIPARMTCARYIGEEFQEHGLARVPLSKNQETIDRAHDEYSSNFEAHQNLYYIESDVEEYWVRSMMYSTLQNP